MTKVNEIQNYMNEFSPPYIAMDRDNVGLIVGKSDNIVKKVLVTLDVDEKVVNEAAENKCDLIISHHPLMFYPTKRITDADPMQRTVMKLVENNISLFSAHTNLDCVCGGLNDFLAEKLEIIDTSVIEVCGVYREKEYGFGRVGRFSEPITLEEAIKRCADNLNINALRYVGDEARLINRVAVNCGGGADEIEWCIRNNVDLFITGDVKYNPARDAYENKMAVIDAGHFETEYIVKELFVNILSSKFSDVEFIISKENEPVFKYYTKNTINKMRCN